MRILILATVANCARLMLIAPVEPVSRNGRGGG